MKRYVTIHGHFYQPPRENPWLEAVETEESAWPYHDWNERITSECYRPNGAARLLDEDGTIRGIVNNYERISFNFGPTLFSWLEEHAPDTYARIVEADSKSRERFGGEGPAIAQCYNHIIMPLANRRDRITQIRWGIADFRHRFGREPEGIWLPETAVDTETLELLLDHGIRFTILAPSQAEAVRAVGTSEWKELGTAPVDTTRGYAVPLPSGRSIGVFFYDGPLARSVAFDRLLDRGENFVTSLSARCLASSEESCLSHIATDGESYGHHHRHGDMALAWTLEKFDEIPEADITVYGQFLREHPPELEARIRENSSWSCAHGIERWRSDCGCHTGGEAGWNQQWRTGLRNALDWLRDKLAEIFESGSGPLFESPWQSRDRYIEVILDRNEESVRRWLEREMNRTPEPGETVRALQLLEMQRHSLLMYTSCGWFFNDLSGIETLQILRYAGRAIQLAQNLTGSDLESEFLGLLSQAGSNLPARGNGSEIWKADVEPGVIGLGDVAAHCAVSAVFDAVEQESEVYCYRIQSRNFTRRTAGRAELMHGEITVTSLITLETEPFEMIVLYLGDLSLSGALAPAGNGFEETLARLIPSFDQLDFMSVLRGIDELDSTKHLSIRSLFSDDQRRVLAEIQENELAEISSTWSDLYSRYVPLIQHHARLGIAFPRSMRIAAELGLTMQVRDEILAEQPDPERLASLVREASNGSMQLDRDVLIFPLQRRIVHACHALSRDRSLESLRELSRLVECARALPFDVDLWTAQTTWDHIDKEEFAARSAAANEGDAESKRWTDAFASLGEILAIRS